MLWPSYDEKPTNNRDDKGNFWRYRCYVYRLAGKLQLHCRTAPHRRRARWTKSCISRVTPEPRYGMRFAIERTEKGKQFFFFFFREKMVIGILSLKPKLHRQILPECSIVFQSKNFQTRLTGIRLFRIVNVTTKRNSVEFIKFLKPQCSLTSKLQLNYLRIFNRGK